VGREIENASNEYGTDEESQQAELIEFDSHNLGVGVHFRSELWVVQSAALEWRGPRKPLKSDWSQKT